MGTEPTTRTITLTGRAPVTIKTAAWPVIARGDGDSYGPGGDYCRHQQALGQGEVDRYILRVRQHADGRTLVYAVLDAASAWPHSEDWRGGELLAADEDLPAAIRRVGEAAGLPDSVIRGCVADLPSEVLE